MYVPDEIIFAPTARCNLRCAHCRVSRIPEELGVEEALAFLRDCAGQGIERIGFSGGEPFLRPDFLLPLVKAATELDLLFDRLMTNGLWCKDEGELPHRLGALAEAGFDGRVGLSFDAWHGQSPEEGARFLEALFAAFGRKDCAEIIRVESPEDGPEPKRLLALASLLGGKVRFTEGKPRAIEEGTRPLPEAAQGERLDLPVTTLPYSATGAEDSGDGKAWADEAWFEDDYCEGPGQVLYVHPDGSVAVCCGFANEREALKLGHIREGYEALMERARSSTAVGSCYDLGLGALRRELEKAGAVFPGRTKDICLFCDYLCQKGLLG